MGEGGEYFQDADVVFTVKTIKKEGKNFVWLTVENGEVYMKESGEREENRAFEEKIFDGDTIRFGNYKIRISSYSLMRE